MSKQSDFSVENLIEWLKTMPPDRRYDWSRAKECLIGQWCESKGLKGDALHRKSCELGVKDEFYDIALRETHRSTFGAALDRALAISPGHRQMNKGEA